MFDVHRQAEIDQIVAHAFDQRREIDAALLFARTRARRGQHRFGQRLQLFEIAREPLADFAVLDELRRDAHRGQRRAQIVADGGEQAAAGFPACA